MKTKKDQLTERQRLFCEFYVGPGKHNAALAARLAGYAPGSSHVTGCQLLRKGKIAGLVRGLETAAAVKMEVTRQGVIAQLVEAAEMAKLTQEPSAIVAAMRQVALMCGYYRQEVVKDKIGGVEQNALDRMNGMSDVELLAVIANGGGVAFECA